MTERKLLLSTNLTKRRSVFSGSVLRYPGVDRIVLHDGRDILQKKIGAYEFVGAYE